MDEHKLNRQVQDGLRAKEIMEDPLVTGAFGQIEAEIIGRWKETQGSEKEQRENAYLMFRLMQNLRGHFEQIIVTGKSAEHDLLKLKDKSKIRRLING